MRIMTKFNFLSLGMALVTTASVLSVGTPIINDILYRLGERVLQLELVNASNTIFQRLNRSGVRAAADTAADMQHRLQQMEHLKTARLFIVEIPDNRIVYHPVLRAGDRMAADFIDQMLRREKGAIEYDFDANSRYAVFTTIYPVNWLVVLSISKSEMLEKRSEFLRDIGVITFIVLGFNSLVVSLFAHRLVARIGVALDCVNRIEKGELSARIPVIPVQDAIGHLQEGINAMSAKIKQRTMAQQETEKALREREGRIRRLVESNIIGVFFWDIQGSINEANDAFLRILGYSRDYLLSGKILWTDLTPPEHEAADALAAKEVISTGTCIPYEKEFFRKNGSRVPVLIGAALFEGSQRYGVAFVLDLTERKRAEEALRNAHNALEMRVLERTGELKKSNQQLEVEIVERKRAEMVLAQRSQELARSNAELEQLAYVASHDLQEPLRMVVSYMQLLEQRYKDRLDGDAHEFIGFAVNGAKRMQLLIDDLLAYSRVDTRAKPWCPTDCAVVVAMAMNSLRMAIDESNAHITCGYLPTVMGDPMQLTQLFQNLIANAIKFRRDQAPEIYINAERENDFFRFSVQDNGIGIAPEYFDRVFEMFQRLHSRSKYAGTGIGLALCKKIVERHGGFIWVESSPAAGSTFKFTLRAEQGNQS